jgi:hypothetical protein
MTKEQLWELQAINAEKAKDARSHMDAYVSFMCACANRGRIEKAIHAPDFAYTRQRGDFVYIYRRESTPTGVILVGMGEPDFVREILADANRTAPLSPTEGLRS